MSIKNRINANYSLIAPLLKKTVRITMLFIVALSVKMVHLLTILIAACFIFLSLNAILTKTFLLVSSSLSINETTINTVLTKPFTHIGVYNVIGIDLNYKLVIRMIIFITIYFLLVFRMRSGRSIKKLKEYLKESAREDEGAPAVTREELKLKIFGDMKDLDHDYGGEIDSVINGQIEPIANFLRNTDYDYNVFSIHGSWGSGKTTRLNIAINEMLDKGKSRYRIYYESAYKYVIPGVSEYARDMYSNIQAFMHNNGISNHVLSDLILDQTSKGVLSKLIQQDFNASESINRANKKFNKYKSGGRLVIVVDDIDRLSRADQVYELFSIISIVRRLSFVKIILIFDRSKISNMLRGNDTNNYDHKFINKYSSPKKGRSVTIKTDYQYMEQEALRIAAANYKSKGDKIVGHSNSKKLKKGELNTDYSLFCGIWAIELLKALDSYIIVYKQSNNSGIPVTQFLFSSIYMKENIDDGFLVKLRESFHTGRSNKQIKIYKEYAWSEVDVNIKSLTNKLNTKSNNAHYDSLLGFYKNLLQHNIDPESREEVYEHIEYFIYDFAQDNWDVLKDYMNYRDLNISIKGAQYYPLANRYGMTIGLIENADFQ